MATTKYTIREQNEVHILKTIIENQSISRADISKRLGLNKATVSQITKLLIEQDFVLETGVGNSTNSGGRRPLLLELNKNHSFSISIDLGMDYIYLVGGLLDGTIFFSTQSRHSEVSSDSMIKLINEVIQHAPKTNHGLSAITLGVHGIIKNNSIVFTPYNKMNYSDLELDIQQEFNVPIYYFNEANLAAIAEFSFSSKSNNLICLSIHTGVGAGVIENGRIQVGKNGQVGEIGHSILFPGGIPCPCGNNGCMEQYLSESALIKEYSTHTNRHLTLDNFLATIDSNDTAALDFIQNKLNLLSVCINNMVMMYNPDVVIIYSNIFSKRQEIITYLERNLNSHFAKDVKIRFSHLSVLASAVGGIALNNSNLLGTGLLKYPDESARISSSASNK